MILQIYLLLFSAYKRNEGYGITGHGKPWSLHGLSTLCESLKDCDGLVVAALFDLHGFWLFVLMLSIGGLYPSSQGELSGFDHECKILPVIIVMFK